MRLFRRKEVEPPTPQKDHSWVHVRLCVETRITNPLADSNRYGGFLDLDVDKLLIEKAICSCGDVVYAAPPVRLEFGKKLQAIQYDKNAADAAHLRHRVWALERE